MSEFLFGSTISSFGIILFLFAPKIQNRALKYKPPASYKGIWQNIRTNTISIKSYVIGLRLGALIIIVFGLLFVISALKPA